MLQKQGDGKRSFAAAVDAFSAIEPLRHREARSVHSDGKQPSAPPVLVSGEQHLRACGGDSRVRVG